MLFKKLKKKRRPLTKRLLALSMLFTFSAMAKTQITEVQKYYPVSATSKSKLRLALNAASPIRSNGKVFHGHTKYHINWRFWWNSTKKECRFTRVETTLELTYTMPKLIASTKEVREVWENWYPKLNAHKQKHGQLSKDTRAC